jgi:hypothetical protein
MEYPESCYTVLIEIRDDGTMDTLIEYRGKFYPYNSEERFGFKSDDEFLASIKKDLDNS